MLEMAILLYSMKWKLLEWVWGASVQLFGEKRFTDSFLRSNVIYEGRPYHSNFREEKTQPLSRSNQILFILKKIIRLCLHLNAVAVKFTKGDLCHLHKGTGYAVSQRRVQRWAAQHFLLRLYVSCFENILDLQKLFDIVR